MPEFPVRVKHDLRAISSLIASPEFMYIMLLFIGTRVILTLIGVLSRTLLEPYHGKEVVWNFSDKLWLDIWGVWDSGWYLHIAAHGYQAEPILGDQASYAFFPLYPLLMKILGSVIKDTYLSGIIISNISLIVACIFLYKLVKIDADKEIALRSVKYLFLFPTAFILTGMFTESLFLAISVTCFYYARRGNWLLVGMLGFFLALTRVIGVVIILPILYEYLKSKPISRDILYLLLIPSGLALYMIYNYSLTGDPLAFVHIQSAWGRSLGNPLSKMYEGLVSYDIIALFLAVFATISLSSLIIFYNKIRTSYWIFGMYAILIPLSTGLDSISRYALVVFPFFILLSYLTKERQVDEVLTIILALTQGCMMVFWSNGFPLII